MIILFNAVISIIFLYLVFSLPPELFENKTFISDETYEYAEDWDFLYLQSA